MLTIFNKWMGSAIVVCSTLFSVSTTAQVATTVPIPDRLVGSYTVKMVDASSFSPIPADTVTTVTISALGTLCTQGLVLDNPVIRGAFGNVVWDVQEADLSFVLNVNDDSFEDLSLLSLSGSSYGHLEFVATSNPTDCGTSSPDANDFFTEVEGAFPSTFPGGPFTFNQIGSGFDVFRFYQKTGIYLGIRDDVAYARGGDYGQEFIRLGDVDDIIADTNVLFRPSQITSFFYGTYRLAMTEPNAFSPIPEDAELTFVITPGGQMCVGEFVLSAPVVSGTNITWTNVNGNVRYALDLTLDDDAESFEENFGKGIIAFQSATGAPYGSFEGDKISLSTECGDASGGNSDLASIDELFGLAEQQYPTLFRAGPQTFTQKNDGFVYRYYLQSGVYVGVKDGQVYLNGGQFGTSEEPVPFGSLSAVLAQLKATPKPAIIPASQIGTYTMTFSGVTAYSPFADKSTANVVITAAGGLCMNGVELATATSKPASPGFLIWENANAGLNLSLELDDISPTELSLQVNAFNGLPYATLKGSKTSLAGICGTSAGLTDIASANQLFGLAEQYYPGLFLANTLSFNQINGNTISRYYATTRTAISIEGDSVSVSGGQFGLGQDVGTVSNVIRDIITANTSTVGPVYDMLVEGTSQTKFANLATVYGRVEAKKYAVQRPDSVDTAALKAAVALAISDSVTKVDSSTVSVFSDTADALVLTATVSSDSVTRVEKDFQLVITIKRRL